MWKITFFVCVLHVHWDLVEANGYHGGTNNNGDAMNFQQSVQGRDSPKTLLNDRNTGIIDPNSWFLRRNAFQRPPNHPGLEKVDQSQAVVGQGTQVQPYDIAGQGTQAQSYSVGGQGKQAQPYSNTPHTPSSQQSTLRGQNHPSGSQAQTPSIPDTGCLLRIKTDCHGDGLSNNQNAGAPGLNYQYDPIQTYPVFTAYDLSGGANRPDQSSQFGPYAPPTQQAILYISQQYPSYGPDPPTQQNLFPMNSGNFGNQQNGPTRQPHSNENFKQPENLPQNNFGNKFGYKPPVVPYTADSQTLRNENNQGSRVQQPQPGEASSGTEINYENQPPYPGCPAAMLCVPENYCDPKGISAGKPLPLTTAEKLYRVALMGCSSPITGEIGVCCRDPEYKDPWPMMEGVDGSGGQDNNQREGKGIQYDDGQYRPQGQISNQQRRNENQKNSDSQVMDPLNQAQTQPYLGNYYQGSDTDNFPNVVNDPKHFATPYPEHLQTITPPPSLASGQYEEFETESPDFSELVKTSVETQDNINSGTTEGIPTTPSSVSLENSPERMEKEEESENKTESGLPEGDTDGFYRPNPWSQDEELNEKVEVPSHYFQVPIFIPDGPQRNETEVSTIVPTDVSSEINNEFGVRAGFPVRKSFVEECPNSMKCLRESYCQEPNPNEGSVDLFDVRLSFKKPTKLKCRQANLPVDGVCCYLREDYMSQVTSEPFSTGVSPLPEKSPNEVCGVRRVKTFSAHSDADETEFGEFPWQVLIFSGRKVCSGAIISPKVIATAASCTDMIKETEVRVRVGEWDRATTSEKKPHQELTVAAIIQHPKYTQFTKIYNLALLYTQEPIKYDYHIGPICLPQPISNFEGKGCTLTGWSSSWRVIKGSVNYTSERYLHQADVTVISKSHCEKSLQKTSLGSAFELPRTSICGLPDVGKNICTGDEGSPLVCESASTGEYTLAGFLVGTQWGINCNQPSNPGVFTSVSSTIDWMYNYVKQDPDIVISNEKGFKVKT